MTIQRYLSSEVEVDAALQDYLGDAYYSEAASHLRKSVLRAAIKADHLQVELADVIMRQDEEFQDAKKAAAAYHDLIAEMQQLCEEYGCLAGDDRIEWLRKRLSTERLDDLGSVQDGLKMSKDGQLSAYQVAYAALWQIQSDTPALHQARRHILEVLGGRGSDKQRDALAWAIAHLPHPMNLSPPRRRICWREAQPFDAWWEHE